MFGIDDKERLLYEFQSYCMDDGYTTDTIDTYVNILDSILKETVINKVPKKEYNDFFDLKNLKYMRSICKNAALRPTYLALLEYLNINDFIDSPHIFREIKENIIIGIPGLKKNNIPKEYIYPKTVVKIFSNDLSYRDEEEKIMTPLISALSFFCLYRQKDIRMLKIKDIDLDKRIIKNYRCKEDNDLAEYIYMNDYLCNLMKEYLLYREKKAVDVDSLFVKHDKAITMAGINSFFGVYKRNENKNKLEQNLINSEALIRSMIYYSLINKGEEGLVSILRIVDIKSVTFNNAFTDYIENKKSELATEYAKSFEIIEVLPLKTPFLKTNSLQENKHMYSNFDDDFLNIIKPYSRENDLNFEDLEVFEMESSQNQDENKIQIQRLVRNTTLSQKLKELYEFRCQLCGYRVPKADATFSAEAHHIQPYSQKHKGDDTSKNLLVLCPNCHTQFDDSYFAIEPDTYLIHSIFDHDDYHLSELILKHELGESYLKYAWELFQNKKNVLIEI